MPKYLLLVLLIALCSSAASAQSPASQASVEHIIKQARAAIGPEEKLHSITSLAITGPSRRMVGDVPVVSDMEYLVMLPDKFRRNEVRQPFSTITVVEGDTATIKRVPTDMALGNNLGALIRESNDPQVQARRQAAQRNEFSRLMLGWFLTSPSYNPVEYSYAGETTENGRKMLMIDAKGQGNFKIRLYLDQKTHQIQMLTFRGRKLVNILNAMRNAPEVAQLTQQDESKLTPEQKQERQAQFEKWRKEFQEAVSQAPVVEIRWTFGKFKKVDGLHLPHYLSRAEDGEMFEEWEINQFKINPKLTAAAFENK
jgi:outer membrane lipoprotein-sorting protein